MTMQTLAQELIDQGLKNRVLTEKQLARVLEGSQQRRYGLVNRALKAGDLIPKNSPIDLILGDGKAAAKPINDTTSQ